MAVTASGLYVTNFIDILKNDTAIDLAADSLKVALLTNSITPDFDADTAYSATNEVSGTGYSAGGAALAAPTVAAGSAGSIAWRPRNCSMRCCTTPRTHSSCAAPAGGRRAKT
jgi:hypothetical protein